MSTAVATGVWSLDPRTSSARFRVRDKLATTTRGTVPLVGGGAVVDDAGTVTGAFVELDLAGIDTGLARRDAHLRSPGLLGTDEHPVARVETTAVEPTPDGWRARARLRARGGSAPLDLAVRVAEHGAGHVVVHVAGDLDRSPLGMRVPSFVIGRTVHLEVDLTLRLHP
ncbi:YceI family protein [Pimelobacter simplex]|uniref:YceI family protein n=1 Tax=Nocardioides simplex TaxID=2045 RepID=UPI00214FC612|nr:YceI family protein [Pimelobacter simplex]UUW89578.1 YceI family protein [Pimelobacter simplex]UUW93407.1 YceI family protein [Pimelobacter simplex]